MHVVLLAHHITSFFLFALPWRESKQKGASLGYLKGFVFLNHSQSVIQPVHPAVSLLPQPLSSSPAIREPPFTLTFSASITSTTTVCQRKMFALKFATGGFSNDTGWMLWWRLGALRVRTTFLGPFNCSAFSFFHLRLCWVLEPIQQLFNEHNLHSLWITSFHLP